MARHSRQVLFFFLALVTPAQALPQFGSNTVTVSGVVLTEGDNQRMEHVTVRLCDTGGTLIEQTITPDSGQFTFRRVQSGRYILTFEANGFQNAELHLDLSFNSDKGVTVYMKPVVAESAAAPPGFTISAHELSMPRSARELVDSGRKKLYAEKNADAGLQDFEQAVTIASGYYEGYREIAMAYLALNKPAEAMKNLRKSIEVSNDSYGDADIGLGTLLVEKGELDAGEKSLRRGVELNPHSWMGFYELGKLELSRDRLASALECAERAKGLSPGTPIIYRLLANIHLRQKDYRDLLDDLDDYIKLDPHSPAGVRAQQMRGQVEREAAKQGKPSPRDTKQR